MLTPPFLLSPHKGDRASKWKSTICHMQVVWSQAVILSVASVSLSLEWAGYYLRLFLALWHWPMGNGVVIGTLLGRK